MKESEQNLLETRSQQAVSPERWDALGPQQKQLLAKFVGQEVAKLGDKCPTVEQLQGILWEVENYWPEELIPLSKSWEQPRQTNSELSE
jgi:hypothetical protein